MSKKKKSLISLPVLLFILIVFGGGKDDAAPEAHDGKVVFTCEVKNALQVYLAGEFNDWSPSATPMTKEKSDLWVTEVSLPVGFHQYKFVVDGDWIIDEENPAKVLNNFSEYNSIFYLNSRGEVELRSNESDATSGKTIEGKGTVYLALMWHQHQPSYLDASRDQLIAPWVRTHTTKDYYDMTSLIGEFPGLHMTMNLTPVLLHQLDTWYVKRLAPYYDGKSNRIRSAGFLKQWRGKTDPWVDLMFKETGQFDESDDAYLFRNEWSCFSISHVIMNRFPEYAALRAKDTDSFTTEDKRDLKCFFWLANFDPSFLRGKVDLVTGKSVDLSDMVEEMEGPSWVLNRHFTEDDANRLVAEFFKIAEAVIPLHRQLKYVPETHEGQLELITTPYFHPILPLITDLHAGKSASDEAPDSIQYSYETDASKQVEMAYNAFHQWFGSYPSGMWPAEGSVSEDVLPMFSDLGVQWLATGDGVLEKSQPKGMKADRAWYMEKDGSKINLFFRDTHLSDMIGFRYQRWDPEEAAEDLINLILQNAPVEEEESTLLTILLDGENAWEWYTRDPDARQFLRNFYSKLQAMQDKERIITVTPTEYLRGNPSRDIDPVDFKKERQIKKLWPGSWIRADYSTWAGEDEENRAWWWLAKVRADLDRVINENKINPNSKKLESVWSAMYAAEGSDWFWWYGMDQNTGEGDSRWDKLYRAHLKQVYIELQNGGIGVEIPEIPSLMSEEQPGGEDSGSMAPGK